MPTQNSASGLHNAPRAIVAVVASASLLLCVAGTASAAIQEASSDDWTSMIFSTYGISILLALLLVGLIVYKKVRGRKQAAEIPVAKPQVRSQHSEKTYLAPAGTPPSDPTMLPDRRAHALEGVQVWEKPADVEPSVYGAYRIDQEVGKLVLGKPHRMDVMASRATDDRRAIEASLVKVIESSDTAEEGRRRARQALEEYGFVARQSAVLLLGRDAWERSSAARALGQIGSQSSLNFLIEALHDTDSVVRNQAVSSLGALKMPAAIGALLDIARRHPDIPASLLCETLSECSVESLGYLDAPSSEPARLADRSSGSDIPDLESFVSFEDLPVGSEDQALTEVLGRLEGSDKRGRAQVIQELAMHPVQRSVSALTSLALNDPDSAIRSAAITGLGSIDHESVFAPVLIALADDSREVRAAAARTLTSLHFDRADAYVRVMETADDDTLRSVAKACVKTGLVAQAVERLGSEDRRQAYEAFSLFSLLARANETEPILNVIQNHKDDDVRLCAIRVLNVAAQPDLAPKLREMVAGEGLPDNVRSAGLEVLYKLDQEQPGFDLSASDNEAMTLHNSH